MGEFNSDEHYIYYCRQESLKRSGVAFIVNIRVQNAVLECNLKNDRMVSVHFQGKLFNIIVIQVYDPTTNAEEAEVDWFHGPTRLSRTNTKKRCPFHHRGLECKSRKSRDNWRDCPAVPVVETVLTKGAEVQSLVRELTSHMPRYGAKKVFLKKKRDTWNNRQVWSWSTK